MNAQTKALYNISTAPELNLASHFLTAITRTDRMIVPDTANQAEIVKFKSHEQYKNVAYYFIAY
jgi:hypothetical protein